MTSSPYLYPIIEKWVFSGGLLQATVDGIRACGNFRRESGAFWLGTRTNLTRIAAVVFPNGAGVIEAPGFWRVSADVFGTVTRWAVPRGLCLLGLVHAHIGRGAPFLSWTDRIYGVRVPGVLSIVIPNGGRNANHLNWGWYVFDNGDYRKLSTSELRQKVTIDPSLQFAACFADQNEVRPRRAK
jgi:hypothetical protein